MENKKYKMIDLCAGTGAFSLGFEQTRKVKIVFSNDFDNDSKIIYDNNFDVKLTLKNIHDINIETEIPSFDILTAGFPCQPFSIAGKQKGFEDTRSNVFFKILNIMEIHKPRIVILENVKNLKSHDKGKTFKKIIECLKQINYHIKYEILNTCKVSKIPQNRERIYIVCFANIDDMNNFEFPKNIENEKKLQIKNMIEKKLMTNIIIMKN